MIDWCMDAYAVVFFSDVSSLSSHLIARSLWRPSISKYPFPPAWPDMSVPIYFLFAEISREKESDSACAGRNEIASCRFGDDRTRRRHSVVRELEMHGLKKHFSRYTARRSTRSALLSAGDT